MISTSTLRYSRFAVAYQFVSSRLCKVDEALEIFEREVQGNLISREDAYCLLQLCLTNKDLENGRRVQFLVTASGLDSVEVLGNLYIRLLTLCGSLVEASHTFDKVLHPSVYTWSAIILGHAYHTEDHTAIHLHTSMELLGLKSNSYVYVAGIKACTMALALEHGRLIHEQVLKCGLLLEPVVGNSLIDMYSKCGMFEESCKVFDNMLNLDIVSWNTMAAAYVRHGESLSALACYARMQDEGLNLNVATILGILKACINLRAKEQGRLIHDTVLNYGLGMHVVVGSALIDMYVKCGSLQESCTAFNKLTSRNVVSWGSIIAGYTQHGEGYIALDYFQKMKREGLKPNKVIFSSILKACGSIGAIQEGKLIHEEVLSYGLHLDTIVGSTLVDMYARCGVLHEARRAFDKLSSCDVASWNAIIGGYAEDDRTSTALETFEEMQVNGMTPDKVTFLIILRVCGSIGDIKLGRLLHEAVLQEIESNVIMGNVLIDMYAKCGALEESWKLFCRLPNRDVVSWNSLIAGYAHYGEGVLALGSFWKMEEEGIKPDELTFSSVLDACSSIGALGQGRLVHEQVLKHGLESDCIIGNAIVDMYAKCGSLEEARKIFDKLSDTSVISCGALIGGYAQHGEILFAGDCFEKMQECGIKPDRIIFLSMLVACCHAGLVDKGHWYFQNMKEHYGIMPDMDHYNCMIDLLGRAGCLREAEDLIVVTSQPNLLGWVSLLNACKMHCNLDLGRRCFKELANIDPCYTPSYVLMSNLYLNIQMKGIDRPEGIRLSE